MTTSDLGPPTTITTKPLRLGSRGPDVTVWQRRLVQLGFQLVADGVFGARTDAATRAFQRASRLASDGIVGPKTLAEADCCGQCATGHEVPRIATPLALEGLEQALRDGHSAAFNSAPSDHRLRCAWAHIALENGRGDALWCSNFGNVTAFAGWTGDWYSVQTRERVRRDPDVWEWVAMRFRAYGSPVDGAAGYWQLMAGRYASALARFDAGDPEGAARELARLGYFTAEVEPYAAAMGALYREGWMGVIS